jgi:exodeoxyribonuclease V alpha subunit
MLSTAAVVMATLIAWSTKAPRIGDAEEVTIPFDGRDVVYQSGELDEVSLVFATTIHKSQGSEYPAVVIPVGMTHYMMLRRNLIYTGVTRGKKLVVLVGQRKAIGIAVRSAEGRRRWSKLRELLESVAFRDQRQI